MAKQCAHCGKILPSDNTRYCTSCMNRVPSSRPIKASLSGEPPIWLKQLESSLIKTSPTGKSQDDLAGVSTNSLTNVPLHELRVKVWEQEETKNLALPGNARDSNKGEEDVIDDLPTRPLSVTVSPKFNEQPLTKSNHTGKSIDDEEIVDGLPTTPLVAYLPETPPMLLLQPQYPHTPAIRQTPPVSMPAPPVAGSKRKNRKRLMLVFVLLFVLLLGGVIAWLIAFEPFAVPEITKTTQPFQNTNLSISLQYPQKWSVEIHKQDGTVNFYDDNHTDQVNITAVATGDQSSNQYVSKVAGSLSLTGQKTVTSLSFAGASWQQIQGSVQQSGASYTATLLVTMHGGRYYAILQLAPSSTYAREDQLVFSEMRSSFQFL